MQSPLHALIVQLLNILRMWQEISNVCRIPPSVSPLITPPPAYKTVFTFNAQTFDETLLRRSLNQSQFIKIQVIFIIKSL